MEAGTGGGRERGALEVVSIGGGREEALARAAAVARDPGLGLDPTARLDALAQALDALVGGGSQLLAFTYDEAAFAPPLPGDALPRLELEAELVYGSDREVAATMVAEYGTHWAAKDPVPPVALARPRSPLRFVHDWRGGVEYQVDFLPRVRVHDEIVTALPLAPRRGMAFMLTRDAGAPPFVVADARSLGALYCDVIEGLRDMRLGQALARIGHEDVGGEVGVLLVTPAGELIGASPTALRILRGAEPDPARQAAVLRRLAVAAAPPPGRGAATPSPRTRLACPDGSFVEVTASFLRYEGSPTTAFEVRALRAGSADRFEAASAPLTARQRDVARLVVQGHKDREVARLLGISIWTVRQHLSAAYARLGVFDRAELRLRLLGLG